jgi:hypothetical protein
MLADTGQHPPVALPQEAGSSPNGEWIDLRSMAGGQVVDTNGSRLCSHKPQVNGHTGPVEKVFRVETDSNVKQLFEVVSDLSSYPGWIDVVHKVESAGDGPGETTSDDDPTWWVTLRAQLGPLARSKRLRMRRTVLVRPEPPGLTGHVRFERTETDGRDHAQWTMEVKVGAAESSGSPSWADCRLYYGGSLWNGLLDGQLDSVADRATRRLQSLVAAGD